MRVLRDARWRPERGTALPAQMNHGRSRAQRERAINVGGERIAIVKGSSRRDGAGTQGRPVRESAITRNAALACQEAASGPRYNRFKRMHAQSDTIWHFHRTVGPRCTALAGVALHWPPLTETLGAIFFGR